MVISRMVRLRRTIQVDTQRMRGKALTNLEELFNMAKASAQDKKMKLSARQKWAHIAAYLAQVINSIATGFDEKEIDVQLSELEKLIDEVKAKTKNGRNKKQVPRAKSAEHT
jgi:hypothetical protein